MKKLIKRGLIAVILASIIGGAIPVMGKIGLKVIPPITFTTLRFLIASLCLIPFIKKLPRVGKKIWINIFLVTLLATANVTLFAFGVRFTTATISQLLYAVVPVISLILMNRFYKEKVTFKKVFGILLGFLGVMILILLPLITKGSLYAGTIKGNITILIAVCSFSLYSVLSKKYQQYVSPQIMTFSLAITTFIVLLPMAIRDYIINPTWVSNLSLAPVLATLYIGIMGGAVYYLLYQNAIKYGGPVVASLTMFLQPIATYIWAVLLLGEKIIPGVLIGAILTVAGAKVVTQKDRNKKVIS